MLAGHAPPAGPMTETPHPEDREATPAPEPTAADSNGDPARPAPSDEAPTADAAAEEGIRLEDVELR